jgi:hypothetical protein
MNKAAYALLSEILQGLTRMCNHCNVRDCEICWSNDICEKIKRLFQQQEAE